MKKNQPPRVSTAKQIAPQKVRFRFNKVNPFAKIRARLRAEMGETHRRPTLLELTEIAAVLNGHENWQQFIPYHIKGGEKISLTDAALGLWERSQITLQTVIMDEGFSNDERESNRESRSPAVAHAMLHERFPISLDHALKLIVGRKIRNANRHKRFNDFLRDTISSFTGNGAEAETKVRNQYLGLKESGFNSKTLDEIGKLFSEWNKKCAKEKARKAAAVRWGKKN